MQRVADLVQRQHQVDGVVAVDGGVGMEKCCEVRASEVITKPPKWWMAVAPVAAS
jgi:hypothetical protein